MINLFTVIVNGDDFYFHNQNYVYRGTAGSAEIASRATLRLAKKDGLVNRQVKSVELIGEKEFGK